MKSLYIADFQVGIIVEQEHLGIGQVNQAEDKNGRSYFDLELVDKTGTIKAKIWYDALARMGKLLLEPGKVVAVTATIQEFRGNLQLNISELTVIPPDQYDLTDFQSQSTRELKVLKSTVNKYAKSIKDKHLRELVVGLIRENEENYFLTPAAKTFHHNYLNGLAEHVVEMLEIADSVLVNYPEASRDYVYGGIILHDIGKINELAFDKFAISYTTVGKLIGHISLGMELIDNYVYRHLPHLRGSIKLYLLKHIILSHHGKLDYGSPVIPKSIEAAIVSNIDELSSKTRSFQRVMSNHSNSEADFSAQDFGLGTEIFLRTPSNQDLIDMEIEQQRLV